MVKVVHQVLYPERKKSHKKSEFFEVNTGEDLIQMLEFVSQTKFNPTEKPLKFTYVILSSGGVYFSETGKSFLKNMISKHLVQSGVSREVIYAGELHFINSQEGAILVVDNSSGTYQPTNEHFELKRLKDLFEYNFSNLNVVTQAFNEK
jgi:hydroxymethylpyrimidine pyrophosphatase-like HAD family hydrolase